MREAIRKVISLNFAPFGGSATAANDYAIESGASLTGSALLFTADALSRQWAPRWLRQTGLDVMAAEDADTAMAEARRARPTVAIVDVSASLADGTPLVQALRQEIGVDLPVIAMCRNDAELRSEVAALASDVVRRPYEWELITRRVVKTVQAGDALRQLRQANAKLEDIRTRVSAAKRESMRNNGMDRVTRLPNLEKFRSLLHKVTAGDSSAHRLCLLVIGIDRFRLVNEAVGYQHGNELLRRVADRLRECLRDRRVIGDAGSGSLTAIAGRLGGARFGLLVTHGEKKQILRVHQAVAQRLNEPFEVAGQSIYVTASVGAAFYPGDCSNADELLHHAENAMFDAQHQGIGFQFYQDLRGTGSQAVFLLDSMLRDALRDGQLRLAYQPILDTATGQIVAAEALLRWHHPEHGEISPADFVPVAESSGLMTQIGTFAIRTACAQLRKWHDSGSGPIRVAVNVSLCQLLRGDMVSTVSAALEEYGLSPDHLELELSERGVLNQNPSVIAKVQRLKALGVRISIDDFGTGQAAIGYLKDLPIDVIKVDRSYISGADRNERDAAIAAGMVALADRLDATVIAEGVETREQLEQVRSWGAAECQGFLFSGAVSGKDFAKRFLKTRKI